MLLVERRPDANTVRASQEIRLALDDLQEELQSVRLDVVVDESTFIEEAITGLTQAVLFGGLLALVVLLLFLRRKRALLAVSVAVPLSLGISLIMFDFLNITFNLISLTGLALGVGLLVDNAIIVVENIARLRESGLSEREAGIEGASEVAGAITASTLTTVAVFLPLTFVEGLAGRLFLDQSLAVVSSLLASLLVGLTVVPLIVAYKKVPSARSESPHSRTDGRVVRAYERGLAWSLDHRSSIVLATVFLLLIAAAAGQRLPREVVPQTNQGRISVHLALPADADLTLVSNRAAIVEGALWEHPGVEHILSDLGERDESRLQVDPRPPYEGELLLLLGKNTSPVDLQRYIGSISIPADVAIESKPVRTQLESLLSSEESDLFIDLIVERRELGAPVLERVLAELQNTPELTNVRPSDDFEVPASRMSFDQESMSRFGVTENQITTFLEAAARGNHVTDLRSINEDVPILLRTIGVSTVESLLG